MAPAPNSAPYLYRDDLGERKKGMGMMFMAERGLRVEIHHTAAPFTPQKAPERVQGMGLTARPRHTQSKGSRNTLQELSNVRNSSTHFGWVRSMLQRSFFASFPPKSTFSPIPQVLCSLLHWNNVQNPESRLSCDD